jgi:hypothetical protein
MGLKIEGNCYVHDLLFIYDQVAITRGGDDANYIGRKLEEDYEKWGLNYKKMVHLGTDRSE